MSSYADRVMETSTTTGTGSLTLDGAVTGYATWDTGIGQNVNTDYCIVAVDASGVPTGDWETGVGYLSAATTLVRLKPQGGSASVPITLAAGTKRVFLSIAASKIEGCGMGLAIRAGMCMP